MIKIKFSPFFIFIMFLVLSFDCFSQTTEMKLVFKPLDSFEKNIKQGSFVDGYFSFLNEVEEDKKNINFLIGKYFDGALYVVEIALKDNDEKSKKWRGTVIFTTPLKLSDHTFNYEDKNQKLSLLVKNLKVVETSHDGKMSFADFEVKQKNKFNWKKIFIFLFGIIIFITLFYVVRRWRMNKRFNDQKIKYFQSVLAIDQYEKVIDFSSNKKDFLDQFPEHISTFKVFEKKLYQYQFKKTQSEDEKKEIIIAFKKFQESIKREQNGI